MALQIFKKNVALLMRGVSNGLWYTLPIKITNLLYRCHVSYFLPYFLPHHVIFSVSCVYMLCLILTGSVRSQFYQMNAALLLLRYPGCKIMLALSVNILKFVNMPQYIQRSGDRGKLIGSNLYASHSIIGSCSCFLKYSLIFL